MKKRLSIFLFTVFVALPVFSQNEDDFEVLQKPDNMITITGYRGGLSSITIPANIRGQTVNEIGSNAFSGNTTLRSVIISNPITIIGNAAFSGASKLSSVRFSSTLLSIGDAAFSGASLASIELPPSLRSIGNEAFAGNKLIAVVIPASVTRIGVDAFARNPLMTEISLGEGLENVFFNAFGSGENPLRVIVVRKTGLNLGAIGLDQSFVNVYGTSGSGVYMKRGNVWIKETSDPATFVLPSLAVGGIALPAQAYIAPPSAPSSAPQNDTAKLVGQVYTVYFPGNGASFTGLGSELAESNKNTLEELSALLQANRNLNIRVTGYANPMRPTAREERNVLRPLSLRRAEAVAQVLEFYGIARSRMRINGAGGTSPLATYQNRNEWYRNRRVEITLIR